MSILNATKLAYFYENKKLTWLYFSPIFIYLTEKVIVSG